MQVVCVQLQLSGSSARHVTRLWVDVQQLGREISSTEDAEEKTNKDRISTKTLNSTGKDGAWLSPAVKVLDLRVNLIMAYLRRLKMFLLLNITVAGLAFYITVCELAS